MFDQKIEEKKATDRHPVKRLVSLVLSYFFLACVINVFGANFIYWIKHPAKSHMQVFLRTPQNFMWEFED